MNFLCQKYCIEELSKLAANDRHSVLIEGVSGCGKTYLARTYATLLNIPDFQIIEPTVQSIRDTVEACINLSNPVVICIENLDKGVLSASYTLLKQLEEPNSNTYIVVTCRNSSAVPETILSRSVCISCSNPTPDDINQYANNKDKTKFQIFKNMKLWSSVRSFKDVDTLFLTTPEQQEYLVKYPELLKKNDNISNIQWSMSHYPDNSELPVPLAIRYLMDITNNSHIRYQCISCLNDMNMGRIAQHAVLAKFILECKYGGG